MAGRRKKSEPGISSWIPRAVLLELESRGIDAAPLLARHGIAREDLLDPDGWIPQRKHAAFYRSAIEASGDPALGIGAGRRVPIQSTRVSGHCAAVSTNLREAFEVWGRFSDLVAEHTHFGTRDTPRFDAIYWTRPPSFPPLHDDGPSFAICVLDFMAYAIGRTVKPIEVRLTGAAPRSTGTLEKAFHAPIRWGAEHFEIRFPTGTLETPIRFADPKLRALLEETARQELAMRGEGSAAERVRAVILRLGFEGTRRVEQVAGVLGTSARTLQRRLAGESLTYSELRDEALRDAALAMLAEEGAAVTDVAFRLGFASRSGFHRCMVRWTGKRPGELRGKAAKPRR